MDRFLKFFALTKVDEAQRIVYGLVTAEREDKEGETCHYDSTVPQYKAVNDEMGKATDGQNIMPLREMHQLKAIGAGKSIEFDDSTKEIRMSFKVVDDDAWKKVCEKVLTGFSQGGRYLKRWTEGGKKYYTAEPGEVSLVDNPCLRGAVIEYAKADGTVETYAVPEPTIATLTQSILYLSKAYRDLVLNTSTEKINDAIAEGVRKLDAANKYYTAGTAAKGEVMNKEQIAKCAAALGITPEEFTKQFIESDLIGKGAKGMAAVHSHLETMAGHHAEMGKCHKAFGGLHEKMGSHIEKCMKAASDVMGSEGEKGEKAFQALVDELKKAAEVSAEAAKESGMKTEEVQKLIDESVKKALEIQAKEFDEKLGKSLAPNNGGTNVHLSLVDRDGKVLSKADAADAHNPMAIS